MSSFVVFRKSDGEIFQSSPTARGTRFTLDRIVGHLPNWEDTFGAAVAPWDLTTKQARRRYSVNPQTLEFIQKEQVPPAPSQEEVDRLAMKQAVIVDWLRTHTKQEATDWIDTRITDMASVKEYLKAVQLFLHYYVNHQL